MGPNPSSNGERDPVCGMLVDPATAPAVEHAGKSYYFCCPGCAQKFQVAPDQYLRSKVSSSGLVALGTMPARVPMVEPVPVRGAAAKDPVCGMTVNTEAREHRAEYRGEPYFFCSRSCLEKFKARPEDYLSAA